MTTVSKEEKTLTTKEARERLGISNTTFLKYARELGIQPYHGVGRTLSYLESDVNRIYEEKVRLRPVGEQD